MVFEDSYVCSLFPMSGLKCWESSPDGVVRMCVLSYLEFLHDVHLLCFVPRDICGHCYSEQTVLNGCHWTAITKYVKFTKTEGE